MSFYLLDLETTGLGKEGDPQDYILEMGVAVHDDNLSYVDSAAWMIGDYTTYRRLLEVNETPGNVAGEMHRKSGLYDDWMTQYKLSKLWPAEQAAIEAIDWFKNHGLEPGVEPLVGSSIGFDRVFLSKYMPDLNDLFHYRVIDASSQRAYVQKRRPRLYEDAVRRAEEARRGTHRVLDDIHDTVNLLRVLDGLVPRY